MKKKLCICLMTFTLIGLISACKPTSDITSNSTASSSDDSTSINTSTIDDTVYLGNYVNSIFVEQISENDYIYNDVKTLEDKGDHILLSDYSWGFSVDLFRGLKYDLALGNVSLKAENDDFYFRVSREVSPYEDVDSYFEESLLLWMKNELYQSSNKLTVLEDKTENINGYSTRIYAVNRQPTSVFPDANFNNYYYVNMKLTGREFMTFYFRTNNYDKYLSKIEKIIESFKLLPTATKNNYNYTDYDPILPTNWHENTKKLYERINNITNDVAWGIFSPQIDTNYKFADELEEKLGYDFPVMMTYRNISDSFPTQNVKKAYNERGQITMMTLHMNTGNNDGSFGKNSCFNMLDGDFDSHIDSWANELNKIRDIPVLIRFSNEMNTDWTKYAGTLLLSDPSDYIRLYRRVYDRFQQKGVTNTIWIFNPFDKQYPPLNWNKHLAYFPGSEYVQIMGLTAYNMGDYVTWGSWKTYQELYQPLANEYNLHYGKFNWAIGEFATSSHGGDKALWITEMFVNMNVITPKVKIAIWFNYGDVDSRPGKEFIFANSLWIEEEQRYVNAFKNGLKRYVKLKSLID